MRKIDVSQWKEFKISHILTKVNTAKLKYRTRDLPKKPNSIYELPASTSSVINQGLSVYVPKDKATVLSNCLLVLANGDAGTVFYEPKSFTILQDSYALNLTNDYISHNSMNVYLYLASILTKLFHRHFGWNNKAVWTRAKNLMVKLPVDKNGDPDWHYMDEYIAKLATQTHTNISLLRQQQKKAPTVNIDRWKEFKISDIYPIIQHPRTRSKKDYEQGSMPFIASGSTNNGIDCYLEPKDKNDYEKADCLTVSPVDGSCFYQSKPFLARGGGGSSILILRSKSKLNEAVHIFLATIITRKLKGSYSFNTMGNSKSIANVKIKLPVTESDEPDWQYMDNYISSIQQAQKERVARLTSIIK